MYTIKLIIEEMIPMFYVVPEYVIAMLVPLLTDLIRPNEDLLPHPLYMYILFACKQHTEILNS